MIIWSEKERDLLVALVTSMRLNNPVPPLVTLVNQAQDQIPEERRRQITATSQIDWLAAAVKSNLALIKHLEEENKQQAQRIASLCQQIEAMKKNPTDMLNAKELFALAYDKMEMQLKAVMIRSQVLETSTSVTIAHTVKKHKPKVVVFLSVVGDQFTQLQKRCQGVELIKVDADKPSYPVADAAMLTKFSRHAMWETIRKHYPIVIRSEGGLSSWEKACAECVRLIDLIATDVFIGKM